jgi:hypothetical protein
VRYSAAPTCARRISDTLDITTTSSMSSSQIFCFYQMHCAWQTASREPAMWRHCCRPAGYKMQQRVCCYASTSRPCQQNKHPLVVSALLTQKRGCWPVNHNQPTTRCPQAAHAFTPKCWQQTSICTTHSRNAAKSTVDTCGPLRLPTSVAPRKAEANSRGHGSLTNHANKHSRVKQTSTQSTFDSSATALASVTYMHASSK